MKRGLTFLALLLVPGIAGSAWTYRGVVWDADWENRRLAGFGSPEAGRQMDEAVEIGFNSFVFSPIVLQPDVHAPELRVPSELEWGLAADMNRAVNIGMKVIYQPLIWSDKFRDGSESPLTIEMRTEEDWAAWFAAYTDMAVTHARLAQNVDAKIFVLGSEYVKTSSRTADWSGVIRAVKEVYRGKITYAAHGFEEAEAIGFWSDLDFVGMNAYFPLTTGPQTDVSTLNMAWSQAARRLEALSLKVGKPVLVTEVGYASAPGAAAAPRQVWPADTPVDEALQARCYEAMFNALRGRSWLAGFIVSKFKIGVTRPESSKEPGEWYLTFQQKRAESVFRRHMKETR